MASYGKGTFDGFSPYQGDSRSEERGSDFSKLSKDISTNIQKITQNVTQIQTFVNQIGTAQDSDKVRQRVHETTHYTNQLAKETSDYLKKLAHLPILSSEQRQWKMQKDRLTDEFSNALKNFQTVQRTAAEKEKASVQRARAQSGLDKSPYDEPTDDRSFSQGFSQTRQVLQMEQDVDLELLKEREDAIKKLESDIMDVNQIFKDLGMLVHEQGEVLDSIEANIDNATMSVEEGTKQLSKAREYQSRARRKKFCIIIIILVVLAIIGLIIGLSVKG
ncbi:syntaxin-7-like isoform X1 [Biomphalaria pfeifferi]|uniref:Syntaxin-7-like isoform X1 n=1 Tax=Biomphalaria pfeifferi TaxID=112525 RepID=A0AAD8BY27_BIOPF|nr:syntaxin-7-like isoform X1 [Biomphalaria pfeifferi]